MSKPLRFGLAGCGRIAERGYLPAVRGLADVEFVAVADPDRVRASHCATSAGAAVHTSVEQMLAAAPLDALLIAAPAELHVEIAALAASVGLPTLVEKPPALDLAGARALAELDPAPAIGFNRRFLQGVELAPSVPGRGWLELDLELRFRRASWGAHESHDEALLDAGIHLIDLVAFVTTASPIAVRNAVIEPERASFELELTRARARIRCATDAHYAERIEIADRSGRTVAQARTGRVRAGVARLRGGEAPLTASLRRQLRCFASRVRGGETSELADADAAVVAMSVVEAGRRSAALGGAEVTVDRKPNAAVAAR